ncbi:MAG: RNA methyltransferase [Lachnospiraceae bacterium]|nr:RNA methyltransferase [Lachnospiraceae bacterium]
MITSHTNKGIKEVIQLAQKAKVRKEKELFVSEGIKMFLEAPTEQIYKVYTSASFSEQMPALCKDKLDSISSLHEMVSDEVFKKMSDTTTPQGILCVMRQKKYSIDSMLTTPAPLLVILEDIQDPGNLGTIFRSGEGAGVTGIIMSSSTVDIYNPKTIRSTMGSVYRMPFVYVENIGNTINELQKRNIKVYAAHLQGSKPYDVCDYTKGSAFLVGNESKGLKDETAANADVHIKIPMLGEVESLNAAVAASILLYEAARQRRTG